ncbi:hypothetical protein H4R33_001960 [Dimargaris cristalligena]|nr:hypothetical protein H4R33_001960 [Dimargaris cristalligena]
MNPSQTSQVHITVNPIGRGFRRGFRWRQPTCEISVHIQSNTPARDILSPPPTLYYPTPLNSFASSDCTTAVGSASYPPSLHGLIDLRGKEAAPTAPPKVPAPQQYQHHASPLYHIPSACRPPGDAESFGVPVWNRDHSPGTDKVRTDEFAIDASTTATIKVCKTPALTRSSRSSFTRPSKRSKGSLLRWIQRSWARYRRKNRSVASLIIPQPDFGMMGPSVVNADHQGTHHSDLTSQEWKGKSTTTVLDNPGRVDDHGLLPADPFPHMPVPMSFDHEKKVRHQETDRRPDIPGPPPPHPTDNYRPSSAKTSSKSPEWWERSPSPPFTGPLSSKYGDTSIISMVRVDETSRASQVEPHYQPQYPPTLSSTRTVVGDPSIRSIPKSTASVLSGRAPRRGDTSEYSGCLNESSATAHCSHVPSGYGAEVDFFDRPAYPGPKELAYSTFFWPKKDTPPQSVSSSAVSLAESRSSSASSSSSSSSFAWALSQLMESPPHQPAHRRPIQSAPTSFNRRSSKAAHGSNPTTAAVACMDRIPKSLEHPPRRIQVLSTGASIPPPATPQLKPQREWARRPVASVVEIKRNQREKVGRL